MIVMWSGSLATIPEGWLLCNGQEGTPDLRSRFVVGAALPGAVLSPGLTLKEFSPTGTKGGVETVTLTEAQMPHHSHNTNIMRSDGNKCGKTGGNVFDCGGGGGRVDVDQVTIFPRGGNQSHENMPPFYALAYIMKI
jgi:microcystin-dependent protein